MIFLLLFRGVLLENAYPGQEINQKLFHTKDNNGILYNPNVIPIGTQDYEDITSSIFVNMKSFVEKKCEELDEYFKTKYGSNFEDNELITNDDFDDNFYEDYYGEDYNDAKDAGYIDPTIATTATTWTSLSGTRPGNFRNKPGSNKQDPNKQKPRTTDTIDWSSLDTLNNYEQIPDETLDEMNEVVDAYPWVKSNAQCQRYLKVKLVTQIKSNKETGITTDYVDIFYGRNNATNNDFDDFYNMEEIKGQTARPVFVDTVVQIQSINEINLNGEYMDATIALSMRWNDARLAWDPSDYSNTNKIRALKSDVWIPDLNVVNRIHDFSPEDEKVPKLQIQSGGNVTFTRLFRMRAAFDPKIRTYPYDMQLPELKIASTDYSTRKVKITTTRWRSLNGLKIVNGASSWISNEKPTIQQYANIKHHEYLGNSEWDFFAYKYGVKDQVSLIDNKKFSTLSIKLSMQRNEPYYSITMFIPILVMTLLAPIGLILPVDAGEKMGLQITVLLTMVIYVEVLQTNIPVFDTMGNTPLILSYFIVTILVICFCLLVSTHTLFLYHVNEYESKNFSKSEAKVSLAFATFCNCINCNIWTIDPPDVVKEIANHPTDDIHKDYDHDSLHLGMQFFSDMINRICFIVVVLVQIAALCGTIIPAAVYYTTPLKDQLHDLSE